MPNLASPTVSLRTASVCASPHTRLMSSRIQPRRALGTLASLALVVAACGGSDLVLPSGANGERLQLIEGDDQTAPAGSAVTVRPAVRVLEDDEPVAGVGVTFADGEGGGTVEGPTQVTNGEGVARVGQWVLGVEPGLNRLEASAEGASGSPVVFTAEGTAGSGVDRMEFVLQPSEDVDARERFRLEVALVDDDGGLVTLSGIVVYLGLFRDGDDVPSNSLLLGDRFRETEGGVAVFDDIGVTTSGRYRLRALTDDLPEHGPHGPQPALFSDQFEVD